MGGMEAHRAWYDELGNINRDFGKFGKPAAESIVRNMRKRIAATRVEPGDRMAWLNLKLMSSVSPLALGSANNAA